MHLTISSPPPDSTLSRPFNVNGSCDAIPAGRGHVPVTGGPTITVAYLIGGTQNYSGTAQCYADQTWDLTIPGTVGTTTGDNGSLTATCSDTHCPSNTVTGLTVV